MPSATINDEIINAINSELCKRYDLRISNTEPFMPIIEPFCMEYNFKPANPGIRFMPPIFGLVYDLPKVYMVRLLKSMAITSVLDDDFMDVLNTAIEKLL